MANVYAARKRLLVGEEWRQPGDLVPEAAGWRNLHSYISSGAIVLVQTDDVQAYGMNQRIPTDTQLDPRTARVGATHWHQRAGWGDDVVISGIKVTSAIPSVIRADLDVTVSLVGEGLDTVESIRLVGKMRDQEGVDIPVSISGTPTDTDLSFVSPNMLGDPALVQFGWSVELTGPDGVATHSLVYEFPRDDAKLDYTYPGLSEITAQDQTNADRLTGLGFVANPQTKWVAPDYYQDHALVTSPRPAGVLPVPFMFWWDGTAWRPGKALGVPTFTSLTPNTADAGTLPRLSLVGTDLFLAGLSDGLLRNGVDPDIALPVDWDFSSNTELVYSSLPDTTGRTGAYRLWVIDSNGTEQDSGFDFTFTTVAAAPPTFTSVLPNPYTLVESAVVQFDIIGTNFLGADFAETGGGLSSMYSSVLDREIPLDYVTITDTVVTVKTAYGLVVAGTAGDYSIWLATADGDGHAAGTITLVAPAEDAPAKKAPVKATSKVRVSRTMKEKS